MVWAVTYAAAADWISSVGPLLVPLVLSYIEQRGMRRELHGLREELREMQEDHITRIVTLELRVQRLEGTVASVVAT